ncbi:MAG: glutamate--cysteine ligase [Gammaproteobacteria bacterium]|nr:glutamate--cysteine ligase [Gammaproteobacteria bacterium]
MAAPPANAPALGARLLSSLRAPGSSTQTLLDSVGRGIEKESLRVTSGDGTLSHQAHPPELGSALTHPNITTDFSEAQLELITDVHRSPEAVIAQLRDVHRFVYQNLADEILWTASMPCMLGNDQDIPVGRYGSSNIATAKTVYRLGLGNRYGRLMQTISGIHYNFSLPDEFWGAYAQHLERPNDQALRNEAYFGLIRNFQRYSWLLIYLFGASPAVCKSFAKHQAHNLEPFDEGSLYLPYSTSLRMGRLGYQSDAQSRLHISYNSIDEYDASIRPALSEPFPAYERVGVKVGGEYRQLNAALLQIENEFYGTIRPKRRIQSGERPLNALRARGVEYVEVRCIDLNPFLPLGIDEVQIRFLDLFLLYCLLTDSPPDNEAESARLAGNQLTTVERGRQPGVLLDAPEGAVQLSSWGQAIISACEPLIALLDGENGTRYAQAWRTQQAKLGDSEQTPSARVLKAMSDEQIAFFRFAMNQSVAHAEYFAQHRLSAQELAQEQAVAAESLERQARIEAEDEAPFDEFLESYLALP